jgi:glucose-1-phosphate adenylyltransferase
MELIDIVPEFNLYEEYWKIYTKSDIQPPQYFGPESEVSKCIIGVGSEICGKVYNSVIGCGVRIGKNTVVRDSIIMNESVIGEGCDITKAIIAERVKVGNNIVMGFGDEVPNDTAPQIYTDGIVTIGERSVIPDGVRIGKNSVVYGVTTREDYEDDYLGCGKSLITAEE